MHDTPPFIELYINITSFGLNYKLSEKAFRQNTFFTFFSKKCDFFSKTVAWPERDNRREKYHPANMQTHYNEIINSFVDKYGLSRGQVVAEIEKTFSAMLSRWYGTGTVVLFGDDYLQALHYAKKSGIPLQNQLELVSMRGWNTIRRILDQNLTLAACLHEVTHYKRLEHELRWGDIIRKNDDGFLVEIELEKGQTIIAECPLNRIGVHERNTLAVSQRRAFHLRRVDSVKLHGISRVKVVVDRVSKNLVTSLLTEQLGTTAQVHLYCAKRYVGHKSFVEASGFLPKQIILTASRELHEHIQVTVGEKS